MASPYLTFTVLTLALFALTPIALSQTDYPTDALLPFWCDFKADFEVSPAFRDLCITANNPPRFSDAFAYALNACDVDFSTLTPIQNDCVNFYVNMSCQAYCPTPTMVQNSETYVFATTVCDAGKALCQEAFPSYSCPFSPSHPKFTTLLEINCQDSTTSPNPIIVNQSKVVAKAPVTVTLKVANLTQLTIADYDHMCIFPNNYHVSKNMENFCVDVDDIVPGLFSNKSANPAALSFLSTSVSTCGDAYVFAAARDCIVTFVDMACQVGCPLANDSRPLLGFEPSIFTEEQCTALESLCSIFTDPLCAFAPGSTAMNYMRKAACPGGVLTQGLPPTSLSDPTFPYVHVNKTKLLQSIPIFAAFAIANNLINVTIAPSTQPSLMSLAPNAGDKTLYSAPVTFKSPWWLFFAIGAVIVAVLSVSIYVAFLFKRTYFDPPTDEELLLQRD